MLYLIFTNLIAFLSILLLLKFKKKLLLNKFNNNKESHNYNGNILPLGGIILIFLVFLNHKYFNLEFLISCLLIFLLGLSSDLKLIKSPVARFIMMIFVVGIYIYDTSCFENIQKLTPSNRGELEITDLNKLYLNQKKILFKVLSSWWIDAGTPERIEELKKLI